MPIVLRGGAEAFTVTSAAAAACESTGLGFGCEPWFEQKKPCLHLEQVSFDNVAVGGAETGLGTKEEFLGLGAALVSTGFSVVCLPVLHPGISKNKLKS